MNQNNPFQAPKPIGTWQWQSNQDPWLNEEIQWKSYSQELNELLEKAYSLQVEEVDLKEGHKVNLKHMLQINKDNSQQQRKVRRLEADGDEGDINIIENSRKKRYIGVEIPKRTYVSPFGTIQDYLNFFQNRNPFIQEFTMLFAQIEQNGDMEALNSKAVPLIIEAIEKEAEFLLLENKVKQLKSDRKELVKLFTSKNFSSLIEFYECILKVYTLHSFLFSSLNSILREEDWPRLEHLLPYAFCLGKAFLHPSFTGKDRFEELKKFAIEQGHAAQGFIELYRGSDLSEELLAFYNTNKIKYFSWNGVTSTTKKSDAAEFFMKKNEVKNTLVLFIIQVPLNSDKLTKKALIDIKSYSFYPEEEEVILAPGSIFELVKFEQVKFQDKPQTVEITLKLVRELDQLKLQGILMQGVFNSENGKAGKDFLMTHLQDKELEEAITHLKGNKLVERLEINSCTFTEKTGKLLLQTLKTIPNLKSLKLFTNSSEDTSYATAVKEMSTLKVQDLEVYDQYKLSRSLNHCIQNMEHLKNLNLSFKNSKDFGSEMLEYLFDGIKPREALENMRLNFTSVKFLSKKYYGSIQSLCESLKSFPSLISLDLIFEESRLDDVWLIGLFEGIKHLLRLKNLRIIFDIPILPEMCTSVSQSLICLKELESLVLSFSSSEYNSIDQELYDLGLGLANLTALRSLKLYFDNYYKKITDKNVLPLIAGVMALQNLEDLYLGFEKFSSDRLVQIIFEGVAILPSLKCFGLNCSSSNGVTDKMFTNIPILKSLTSLTLLINSLNLSNDGIQLLVNSLQTLDTLTTLNLYCWRLHVNFEKLSKAFKSLKNLTELNLDFGYSDISRTGIRNIALEIGQSLTSLVSLKLGLWSCSSISNGDLKFLSEQIQHLPSLETLELNLRETKISDDGIHSISTNLRDLKKLKNFTLNASDAKNVTKKGLHEFEKEMRAHAQIVNVPFGRRADITGQRIALQREIKDLKEDTWMRELKAEFDNLRDELAYFDAKIDDYSKTLSSALSEMEELELESIVSLDLIFDGSKTDDKALKALSKAVESLTVVRVLKLSFVRCRNITDKGVKALATSLRRLSMLKHLVIKLNETKVGDDGVEALCKEIGNLNSLVKLKLDLGPCYISGEKNLFNFGEMKSRTSLLSLNISLFGFSNFEDEWVENLFGNLRTLTSLRDLRLRFGESDLSDFAFQFLSGEIREMKSLTRLKLKIIASKGIGDDGYEYIAQAVKQLTALQILELNFSWTKLTDEALVHFSKGIRSLGDLRKIDFRFQGCTTVSEAREESLRDLLRYLGFK